jgi:hypothetical protein
MDRALSGLLPLLTYNWRNYYLRPVNFSLSLKNFGLAEFVDFGYRPAMAGLILLAAE